MEILSITQLDIMATVCSC
uniref:Uncharacterized protein n=1 Tax=Rhizophora mucronata TaxID=61149 RepID=A0A2P2PVL2_RHIMU